MTNDELERQAFERWQRTLENFNEECLIRDTHGKYWWRGVQMEWQGWLARARQESNEQQSKQQNIPEIIPE